MFWRVEITDKVNCFHTSRSYPPHSTRDDNNDYSVVYSLSLVVVDKFQARAPLSRGKKNTEHTNGSSRCPDERSINSQKAMTLDQERDGI